MWTRRLWRRRLGSGGETLCFGGDAMTMIVMFVSGALFALIAAILRFEPNARVLSNYGDSTPLEKNRWASRYLLVLAVLSVIGGAVTIAIPAFTFGVFALWLTAVFVIAIYVASK